MTGVKSAAIAFSISLMCMVPSAHAADRQKQVLVLLSTRRDAPLARVVDRDLELLLRAGLTGELDYYTEPLDSERFAHKDYRAEFGDFLLGKYQRHHLDLVIAFGDRAMDVVAFNRNRLFSGTPVVFYTLGTPRDQIPRATGLVNPVSFRRSLELGMALQPGLKHLYVVSGDNAVDREYEQQARQEFLPFVHRFDLVYLSGLPTKELERRLSALPPQSAVFYVLVTKDGEGDYFEQMSYLWRVAAVANAPTYSWVDVDVDAGIVGGHRRNQAAEVAAVARTALRVLHGDRVEDIPVASLQTDVFQADSRQLRRWGLSESRLPPGTRVAFREPDNWERYKDYVIVSMTVLLAQSALIGGLLVQRRKRRRAEIELRGSETRLRASYDRIRSLGRRLLNAHEEERARVARDLHDDIGQQLAVLCIELDSVGAGRAPADVVTLSRAIETAHGVASSVRALSHQLHPNRLRLLGLVAALASLQRECSTPQMDVDFSHSDVPPEIDQHVALSLFRVAQEALRNAAQHSGATHVQIRLAGTPSGVTLTVSDDGKGFDVDAARRDGLGLSSMHERMESAGGILEIYSTTGAGTRLTATAPIGAAGHAVSPI